MDQETARVLFREGAILLLLNMPEGSEFGIDYNSWTVGPKFRGVKMIPPGIHYIYYRYREPTCFYLSLVVRRPVFGVFDQVRHKPVSTATEDG